MFDNIVFLFQKYLNLKLEKSEMLMFYRRYSKIYLDWAVAKYVKGGGDGTTYRIVFNKVSLLNKETKLMIHSSIFRPNITHGNESWVDSKSLIHESEIADMKVLRMIIGDVS